MLTVFTMTYPYVRLLFMVLTRLLDLLLVYKGDLRRQEIITFGLVVETSEKKIFMILDKASGIVGMESS